MSSHPITTLVVLGFNSNRKTNKQLYKKTTQKHYQQQQMYQKEN